MKGRDPREDPERLTDEDLLVELGVAVGSLTALEIALAKGVVRADGKNDVHAGISEWAARIDRLEAEVEARGFSIVVHADAFKLFTSASGTSGRREAYKRATQEGPSAAGG